MSGSGNLDWLVQQDKPLLQAATRADSGLEATYDMVDASRGIQATEHDTVPMELMEIFFK